MEKKVINEVDETAHHTLSSHHVLDEGDRNALVKLFQGEIHQDGAVSMLQENIRKLEDEKSVLLQDKELLEIDKICLKQQKFELESRIDDLAKMFPSASILLGKTPEKTTMMASGKKRSFFKRNNK